MDPKFELGSWLLKEARLSFRYWHSSKSCRKNMNKPFFDRTQCEWILKQYRGDDKRKLVA